MTDGGATGRDAARRYGYPAARVMLAAIFVVTGWDKLADPQDASERSSVLPNPPGTRE